MVSFKETLQIWASSYPNVKDKYYKASYCGLFWVPWPVEVKEQNKYENLGGIGLGTKNY